MGELVTVPKDAGDEWAANMSAQLRNRAIHQLDILRDRLVRECLETDEAGNSMVPLPVKVAVAQHIAKSTTVENVSKVATQPAVAVGIQFIQSSEASQFNKVIRS